MEGNHLSVQAEQNSERQTPSKVDFESSPSQTGASDVQLAVTDALPTQESAAETSSTELASQSMGAFSSRKSPLASESRSGKDGSDDQEAPVQGMVEGNVRECKASSVTSGTAVSGRNKGKSKKSAKPKSSKQAAAATGASSAELGKDSVRQELERVREEREKSLKCSVEERRKLYACGSRFHTLDSVLTWPQYYKSNRKDIETYALRGVLDRRQKQKKGMEKKMVFAVNDELNRKVSLWTGNITTLEIDCIVNAANSSLLDGGGVDGAIHAAAGSRLYSECRTLKGCETGHEKDTAGYDLPSKYVIHTVGPRGEKPALLRSCYSNCLQKMLKLQQKTIAFPCISTGVYGYPNEKAVEVALGTVRHWLEDLKKSNKLDAVERVVFCLFLPVDVECYSVSMCNYFPVSADTSDVVGLPAADTLSADTLPGITSDVDGNKDVKMSDATQEQMAVSVTKQNTSPLSDSKNTTSPLQKTRASDETCRQQKSKCGKEPQRVSELEASEQKEVAIQDSKEHQDTDEQKLHDSGRLVASEPKEGERPIVEMQTGKEQISDSQKEENLHESKEHEMTETSAQQAADGGNVDSEQLSREQAASDAEQRSKVDESVQQGHGDAVGENIVSDEMAIKPELSDDQRALSRL